MRSTNKIYQTEVDKKTEKYTESRYKNIFKLINFISVMKENFNSDIY